MAVPRWPHFQIPQSFSSYLVACRTALKQAGELKRRHDREFQTFKAIVVGGILGAVTWLLLRIILADYE